MAKKDSIAKGILKKTLNPRHVLKAVKSQRSKREFQRASEDPQLKLIAKLCPGDFLNYGHFDDTTLRGEDLSVNDILNGQTRNAELLVGLLRETDIEILDAGCGMGGITRLLAERGLKPVALSPNKHQIANLKAKYPDVETIEAKFERMPLDGNRSRFDAIIMSESLQYMELDETLSVVEKILKPGGIWLVVDFFRMDEIGEKSGQVWEIFASKLQARGWKITREYDHTANVLPLLRYIFMIGNDVLRPIVEFVFDKLKEKNPGVHYLLQDAFDELNVRVDRNLDIINPELFAAHKRYVLLSITQNE